MDWTTPILIRGGTYLYPYIPTHVSLHMYPYIPTHVSPHPYTCIHTSLHMYAQAVVKDEKDMPVEGDAEGSVWVKG